MFLAYECLKCGNVHGWIDHPDVTKVQRHDRFAMEDVWYCPCCNQQHRTTDGTWLGQTVKKWREITSEAELRLMDERWIREAEFEMEMLRAVERGH